MAAQQHSRATVEINPFGGLAPPSVPVASESGALQPQASGNLFSALRPVAETLTCTAGVSAEDLAHVRALVGRIRLPWRVYLANSAFLQISIPEIASTVSRSQRYSVEPRQRIESTRRYLKTLIHQGPDSPEASALISRVNEIHRGMGIDSKSPAFSFVLYTLSHEFIRSLRNNSSVQPTQREEVALFRLIHRIGEKMGATTNLSSDYQTFIEANQQFQRESWRGSSAIPQDVAKTLLAKAFSNVPPLFRPAIEAAALSFVATETLQQLKLPVPSRSFTRSLTGMLKIIS